MEYIVVGTFFYLFGGKLLNIVKIPRKTQKQDEYIRDDTEKGMELYPPGNTTDLMPKFTGNEDYETDLKNDNSTHPYFSDTMTPDLYAPPSNSVTTINDDKNLMK